MELPKITYHPNVSEEHVILTIPQFNDLLMASYYRGGRNALTECSRQAMNNGFRAFLEEYSGKVADVVNANICKIYPS